MMLLRTVDSLRQLEDIVHNQDNLHNFVLSLLQYQFELDQSALYLPFAFDHNTAAVAAFLQPMLVEAVVDRTFRRFC